MCHFCLAAEAQKPCGVDGFGMLEADLGTIALTIPDDATTGETIAVGASRVDRLDYAGDEDWFRITLAAGQTVQIDLTGVGSDALEDPYLRLYDAESMLVAFDDDGGPGLNSSLVFSAKDSGTYFLEVDSYAGRYDGDYQISVGTVEPADLTDAVEGDRSLNTSDTVYVYFAEAGDQYSALGTTYTATDLNAYERDQLWSIFEGVEEFADIDFEITTDRAAADLEWATAPLSSTLLGFFYFPSFTGEGSFGLLNDASSRWDERAGGTMDAGGFMFGVSIHELGHGLGLGHTHDTGNGTSLMQGVSSSSNLGAFDLNQSIFTAMSYNDGWSTGPNGAAPSYDYGYGSTFGAIDIAALQSLYGANESFAAGDDLYELIGRNASGTGYATIWDTGGADGITYGGNRDAVIDLRAASLAVEEGGGGFVSYVSGIHGGFTIAHDVVIEEASGGGGDDQLTGNDADNLLAGGAGDDSLYGGAGDDVLQGGMGQDILSGGEGIDTASYADSNAGVRADLEGAVTARGRDDGDQFIDIENLLGSRRWDDLRGDGKANRLDGDVGNDWLHGRGGDDLIFGGAGDDSLYGNAGADALSGGTGDDSFIYFSVSDSGLNVPDRDRILDFDGEADVLDLSRIDADSITAGDDAFSFIGRQQFSGAAGELRSYHSIPRESTILEADLDGDGARDFQIELVGFLSFDQANFLL